MSQELIQQLEGGAIGVLPTDTVYGLVCVARNQEAVARLYEAKHRERKPGTIIAASTQQLVSLGLKKRYLTAVEQFWPGAVTVIIPTDNPTLSYLDQGVGSVAVRVVSDVAVASLLEQTGPLLTSSANMPGEAPAATVGEAQAYFGNTIDFYVDGGDLSDREPSTIIRVIDDAVEVVRQGAVVVNL